MRLHAAAFVITLTFLAVPAARAQEAAVSELKVRVAPSSLHQHARVRVFGSPTIIVNGGKALGTDTVLVQTPLDLRTTSDSVQLFVESLGSTSSELQIQAEMTDNAKDGLRARGRFIEITRVADGLRVTVTPRAARTMSP